MPLCVTGISLGPRESEKVHFRCLVRFPQLPQEVGDTAPLLRRKLKIRALECLPEVTQLVSGSTRLAPSPYSSSSCFLMFLVLCEPINSSEPLWGPGQSPGARMGLVQGEEESAGASLSSVPGSVFKSNTYSALSPEPGWLPLPHESCLLWGFPLISGGSAHSLP